MERSPEHIREILKRVFEDMGRNLDHLLALGKMQSDLESRMKARFDHELSMALDCVLCLLDYFGGRPSGSSGEPIPPRPAFPDGGNLDEHLQG